MVHLSGQHKCGLVFCGAWMIVLGLGISATGFVNDFVDPYDEQSEPEILFFTHTQYWLGIPLILLGLYVLMTACVKGSCLMAFGFIAASLVLVLSIFAVILEGPIWRGKLQMAIEISENGCESVRAVVRDLFSCAEMKYHAVIYTFTVAFSVLSILICFFCAFIYFRILGWMLHISYDDPIDDYYAKAVNSHFINGNHGAGEGRRNDVALGTYPQ